MLPVRATAFDDIRLAYDRSMACLRVTLRFTLSVSQPWFSIDASCNADMYSLLMRIRICFGSERGAWCGSAAPISLSAQGATVLLPRPPLSTIGCLISKPDPKPIDITDLGDVLGRIVKKSEAEQGQSLGGVAPFCDRANAAKSCNVRGSKLFRHHRLHTLSQSRQEYRNFPDAMQDHLDQWAKARSPSRDQC